MRLEHTLYVVATPIGHRDDLSARAIETLRSVARIYAEDTRHSLPLMRHHGIETPLRALHEHNEADEAVRVVAYLRESGSAALISDAGTPLISDPGFRVVRACRDANLRVSPVPGPCALSTALSVAGLPTDRFQFVGFPPSRGAARRRWIGELASVPHTLVFYESPHRVLDTLDDLLAAFGAGREITLARELTKRHETVLNGTLDEVRARVAEEANQRRGEFVLIVAGSAWRGVSGGGSVVVEAGAKSGVGRRAGGRGDGPAADGAVTGGSSDEMAEVMIGAGEAQALTGAVEGSVGHGAGGNGAGRLVSLERVVEVLLPRLPPNEVARCAATLCGVRKRDAYARVLAVQARRKDSGED